MNKLLILQSKRIKIEYINTFNFIFKLLIHLILNM
jgi:hypothetical protein